jgi:very-short-patch-repair endonuclease
VLQNRARAMRNGPTEPENRLWQALRNSQLGGYKFRRQAVIGKAIVDFLCPQKGLVVEVDGHTHTDLAADARRTAALKAAGYTVVRVANTDVMQNLEGVLRMVLLSLEALRDRRSPHPNPSPEGEGLEDADKFHA